MGRAKPAQGPLAPLSKLGMVCRRIHYPMEGVQREGQLELGVCCHFIGSYWNPDIAGRGIF